MDLYKLLLRKEAWLVMQIGNYKSLKMYEYAIEAEEQKKLIQNKRLSMKAHIREIA